MPPDRRPSSIRAGGTSPDQPRGHIGWLFSGIPEYESGASSFLARGAARGERLVYLADEPRVGQWPKALLDRGQLVVGSTSEAYGRDRIVNAASLRATFQGLCSAAVRDGYTGLRVAADNTSMIAGPERLAAWMAWEDEAERFIAEHRVTGMCSFDRERVDSEHLRALTAAHRATRPRHAEPEAARTGPFKSNPQGPR